jgi:hypothetical protein
LGYDEAWLNLHVVSWEQIIRHDEEGPQYHFAVVARTSEHEDLLLVSDGSARSLRNTPIALSIYRGQLSPTLVTRALGGTEPAQLERGIGKFFPGEPSGYFWLPDSQYDEIWAQVREHRYDDCVAVLGFAPVERDNDSKRRWNADKNKIASITRFDVRFERKSPGFVRKELEAENGRKLAWIARRDKWIHRAIIAAIVIYSIYFHWWHAR